MSIIIKYYTVSEVSRLTGLSEVTIHKRCAAGYICGLIRRNNKRLIPLEEVKKLKNLEYYPKHKLKKALSKLAKIQAFERKLKKYRSQYGLASCRSLIPLEKIEKFALKSCGVKRTTLFRWKQKYNRFGLVGLIDKRGGGRKKGRRDNRIYQPTTE